MPRNNIDKFKHMHYHWLLGWRKSTTSYDNNLYNEAVALMSDPTKLELVQAQSFDRYSSENRLIDYLVGVLYKWIINTIYRFFNINDFAKNEKLLHAIPLISREQQVQQSTQLMDEGHVDDLDLAREVSLQPPQGTFEQQVQESTQSMDEGHVDDLDLAREVSLQPQGTLITVPNQGIIRQEDINTVALRPRSVIYSPEVLAAANVFGFATAELDSLTNEILVTKYRKLAIKYHPDKGGTPDLFAKLHGHLETLNNFLQASNRHAIDPCIMAQEREKVEALIQKANDQIAVVKREMAELDNPTEVHSTGDAQVTMSETDELIARANARTRKKKPTGEKHEKIEPVIEQPMDGQFQIM